MKIPSGIPLTMKYCANSPAYSETVQAKASAFGDSPGRLSFYSLHESRKKVSHVTLLFDILKNYSRRFAWSRSFQFLGITLFSAYDPKCRIRHFGSASTNRTFLPSMARPTPQIFAGCGLTCSSLLVDNSDYSCFWGHIVLLPFHHSFIAIILIDVMMDVCYNPENHSGKYWAYRLP